jgi:hypothetical protein
MLDASLEDILNVHRSTNDLKTAYPHRDPGMMGSKMKDNYFE